MRVFVLCTGRSGSKAVIAACAHITNFSAGHESNARVIGHQRFVYPERHIEADNRLSWLLGSLQDAYGDQATYVHLKRDRQATVESFNRRWDNPCGIIRAFAEGVAMNLDHRRSHDRRREICEYYYDTVTSNIETFLEGKPHVVHLQLESIQQDFSHLWKKIGADGDLDDALRSFDSPVNSSVIKPSYRSRAREFANRRR